MTPRSFTVTLFLFGLRSIPGGECGEAALISDGALASALVHGVDSVGAGELGVSTGPAEVCSFTAALMPFITARLTPAAMLTAPQQPIALIVVRTPTGVEIEVSQVLGRAPVNREHVQALAPAHKLGLARERKVALAPALNRALALVRQPQAAVPRTRLAALPPPVKPARHQVLVVAAGLVEAAAVDAVEVAGAAGVVGVVERIEVAVELAAEEGVVEEEGAVEEEVTPAAMEVASKLLTKRII
jgi:hypothetical protein